MCKRLLSSLWEFVPNECCPVEVFPVKLKVQLDKYLAFLEKKDLTNLNVDINDVREISEAIYEAVKLNYCGQYSQSFNQIANKAYLFDKYLIEIPEYHSFYRMRVVEGEEKRNLDHKKMFHVPFSLRDRVSAQRYSAHGLPCLYLSESTYGCWEELGRPNINSCVVSRLENIGSVKLWDLSIPDSIDTQEENGRKRQNSLLTLFPLTIASMFKVNNTRGSFKPEYIIPQILLQYISFRKPDVRGIAYTSVLFSKDLSFPSKCFKNYAIPARNFEGEQTTEMSLDYCSYLCNHFIISKPLSMELEIIKNPRLLSIDQKQEDGKDSIYKNSLFGYLELRLKSKDFELKKIIPTPLTQLTNDNSEDGKLSIF